VLAALLDADRLCRRDLHVMDPLSVPDRLEDRIRETEDENVLYRLFAEVVIDAIRLVLGGHAQEQRVQVLRRLEAAPERLLDDDAGPWPLVRRPRARRQSALRQIGDDRLEHARRNREVEEPVALVGRTALLELNQTLADRRVILGPRQVGRNEVQPR